MEEFKTTKVLKGEMPVKLGENIDLGGGADFYNLTENVVVVVMPNGATIRILSKTPLKCLYRYEEN